MVPRKPQLRDKASIRWAMVPGALTASIDLMAAAAMDNLDASAGAGGLACIVGEWADHEDSVGAVAGWSALQKIPACARSLV
jgi:hypothetical protein